MMHPGSVSDNVTTVAIRPASSQQKGDGCRTRARRFAPRAETPEATAQSQGARIHWEIR